MLRRHSVIQQEVRWLQSLTLVQHSSIRRSIFINHANDNKRVTDNEHWIRNNDQPLSLQNEFNKSLLPNELFEQSKLGTVTDTFIDAHINAKDKIIQNPKQLWTPTILSDEEYNSIWKSKFSEASSETVKKVMSLIRNKNRSFSSKNLLELILSLSAYQRIYEIHEICMAYLPHIKELNDTSEEFEQLLINLMRVESKLNNYMKCEEIFSIYIKRAVVDPKMVQMGLKAFVANDNFYLAKEVYIQALNNPEVFPMTIKELYVFLLEIFEFKDYRSMEYIFTLWLQKKCSKNMLSKNDPNIKVISLMHKAYLIARYDGGVLDLEDNEFVKRSKYLESIDYQITKCLYNKQKSRTMSNNTVATSNDISNILELLSKDNKKRRSFYLSLLNVTVYNKNFEHMKYVIDKITKDDNITFDASFHAIIAKYFAKNGLIREMVSYYENLIFKSNSTKIPLNSKMILLFRDCVVERYPVLLKEINNELTVFARTKTYYKNFYFLRNVSRKLSQIIEQKVMGSTEYSIPSLNDIDYNRYKEFKKYMNTSDFEKAEDTLIETIRRGIKPKFNYCYIVLSLAFKRNALTISNIMDNFIRDTFETIPMKVKIMWLNRQLWNNHSIEEVLPASEFQLEKNIQGNIIRDFESQNRDSLNFLNYIQLSQICINCRDLDQAAEFLTQASTLINKSNRRHWVMYYMTNSKFLARSWNMEGYLANLQSWNTNTDATLITPGCIRQLKAYNKIFLKREDFIEGFNLETLEELEKEIQLLKDRYIEYKFQGLEDIKLTCNLLQRWIEHDLIEKESKLASIKKYRVTKGQSIPLKFSEK